MKGARVARQAQLNGTWLEPDLAVEPGPVPPAKGQWATGQDGWWRNTRPYGPDPAVDLRQGGIKVRIGRYRPVEGQTNVRLRDLAPGLVHWTEATGYVAFPRLSGHAPIVHVTGQWPTGPVAVSPEQARALAMVLEPTEPARVRLMQEAAIPAWFGLALYPYQEEGAKAATSGRPFIADEPGLGKSRQALACAALLGARRVLVVCPPLVTTSWMKESQASRIGQGRGPADPVGDVSGVTPDPEHVVGWFAGRKSPVLPEAGVAVVPYSLLSARKGPEIRKDLAAWKPELVVLDEAHLMRNGRTARTRACKSLLRSLGEGTPAVCLTGTPVVKNPKEIVHQADACNRLGSVFGGTDGFYRDWFTKMPWGEFRPKADRYPQMAHRLNRRVWVRRLKRDVLPDLPAKTRQALVVDVPLAGYRRAHKEVLDSIREWVEQVRPAWVGAGEAEGERLKEEMVDDYCRDVFGHITRLRVAAGLAKAEAAADLVATWVDAHPLNPEGLCDDPLIVWCHHEQVAQACMDAALAKLDEADHAMVARIAGSTPAGRRGEIVEAFQKGQVRVLVASIVAAGVGVTLTRASQAYFVETDWTPANVIQAEDRTNRIGQTRAPVNTTLIAPGTLDETIQKVQADKGRMLEQVLGGDVDPSLGADFENPSREILKGLVLGVVDEKPKKRRGAA